MKLLITYFQNKRVALPAIFGKYVLPMMASGFPGEVKLYHVVHDLHAVDERLASNRAGEAGLHRVRDFLARGEYGRADVVTHGEECPDLYALPSFRIGMRLCLDEGADYHLWLEDDAIVCDDLCGLWPRLMGDADVGLFRQTQHIRMVNSAFALTTPGYDRRLLDMTEGYRDDHVEYELSSQFESTMWRAADKTCLLHPHAAARHHPRGPYAVSAGELASWLRRTVPGISENDIALLRYDFADYDTSYQDEGAERSGADGTLPAR